jgi:hypothetical protein
LETCLEKAKAKLKKTKVVPKEMKEAADVCEERQGQMDTTDMEASRGKPEAIMVHHEVTNEETAVETVETPSSREF